MTDLADFIARYAKPYDPATDIYRRPPFATPIKAGKNTPIYNAHSYHTKVPPLGIVPYLEHYTDPGDLVLDPFCGSGMTGVACLMTGRHAILNDLSPAAVHIATNYCTPVDVAALKREFERIKAAVQEEFAWLYGTTCDRCGGPATIQYTIWSDVFACGRCGGEIVLWDVAVDQGTGKVNEKFACPACGKEQVKKGLKRLASIPVITNYECMHCRPGRAEHPTTHAEKKLVEQIGQSPIPYWYPTDEFPLGRQTRKIRHGTAGISHVDQMFTTRNLWAFGRLWHEVDQTPDSRIQEALRFALTAIMQRCSRLNRLRPSGAGDPLSGTLYVGSLIREESPLNNLTRKITDVGSIARANGSSCVCTLVGSAVSLEVPDAIVDYVFTDPPFGENLQYAELNFLWEAWLRQFTDWSQDCVMNYVHGKDLPFYSEMMSRAFAEMYRVLKPGRWASVVFHNTDDAVWRAIQQGAQSAGFDVVNAMAFDKSQGTFNQVNMGKDNAAGFDVVLNLLKPKAEQQNGTASHAVELDVLLVKMISDHLLEDPEPAHRTTQFLHSYVIRQLLERNIIIEQVTIPYLEELLFHHLKLVDGRWYFRGEQVLDDKLGITIENETTAIAWLTRVLANGPQTLGGLIPQWQIATLNMGESLTKSLEQILAENFWQDPRTGRWRAPTAAEREAMSAQADISAQAHLRVVRRFLAGELPQKPTARELAAWVQFCYSREAYREAVALFALLDASQIEEEYYRQLRRIAAVCRSKLRAG